MGRADYPLSRMDLLPMKDSKLSKEHKDINIITRALSIEDFGNIVKLDTMVNPKSKSELINAENRRSTNT